MYIGRAQGEEIEPRPWEGKEVREGVLGFVGQTLASSKMNFAASCAG